MHSDVFVIPEAPFPSNAEVAVKAKAGNKLIRLGVLDNTKGNADHLLDLMVERVQSRVSIDSVLRLKKPTAGLPAPADVMDRLTQEVDCVVTAMAD